ncbi:MAG: PASTA domain-containing protein [Candidatus Hatepunaea meridiana]|nr:PASTA domain-containing protein [Candidatus Hatepunaea meridiana]
MPKSPQKRSKDDWINLVAGMVIVIIASIWLIFSIDRVVMPLIALAGIERDMPNLHHRHYYEADSVCSVRGLNLIWGRTRIDDNLPPGTILDQFPVAGVKVKPGRRVEVVVSNREGLVICPDVVGKSPREAGIIAGSSGLVVNPDKLRYWHSGSYPEGVVMGQKPEPCMAMDRGEELILTVSLGKRPTEIVAPDLAGRKLNDIGIILAKYRLRKGEIVKYPDRSVPPGTILSQKPAPGTPMEAGGKVSLRVAVKPVKDSDR